MSTTATLDEIDRIHDDEPEHAAAALRTLDAAGLPADQLPLLAFLLVHVLGEKLGRWAEAAQRLEQLLGRRADVPDAVVAHAAVAAHLAGHPHNPALVRLGAMGGEAEARTVVELNALGLQSPGDESDLAAALVRLADATQAFDRAGPLNRRLAIGFNNATSRLLDLAAEPVDPESRAALLAGSAAALRFWEAAGTWVNLERALYLQALVHNRIGEPAAARDLCVRALDVIAAHGEEDVDRAFLQLQLAGALTRLGERAPGRQQLAEAQAAAAQWNDPGLTSWFAAERDRLFGPSEQRT